MGLEARKSVERLKRFTQAMVEETGYWIVARPWPRNRIDQAGINRFFETGPELIETIVGAIACGQHVALAGPRGCGKSHCISEAIRESERRGLIPKNGFVKIQGNKELPRDYLIEDDLTLSVDDGGVVTPKRKTAPLFRFAKRSGDEDTRGRPLTNGRDVICFGVDDDGRLIEDAPLRPEQRIVLFLDEVNRFSDGVLDSLLLLLEEGEAVMGGDVFRLPVVVLMTMNPPGYDASARTLSPPLSARIGRQYRLLSPRLDVLTDLIASKTLRRITAATDGRVDDGAVAVRPPPRKLVRRAAAVTLCAWGLPHEGAPGFDYLSPDTRALIGQIARTSPQIEGAMHSLNELCHFGPDGRALGDWIIAASVAAVNEAKAHRRSTATARAEHFVGCAVTVLSHKLQDNFSAASRPDNTRRKEEALYVVASAVIHSTDPRIDRLLRRAVDDDAWLEGVASSLLPDYDAEKVRAALLDAGIATGSEVTRWRELLALLRRLPDHDDAHPTPEHSLRRSLLEVGLLEEEGGNQAFSAPANREMLRWISGAVRWPKPQRTFRKAVSVICNQTSSHSEPVERTLSRFAFIREGIWQDEYVELRDLVKRERLDDIPRRLLIALFECCDTVWLTAEHEGAHSVERLYDLLAGEPGPTTLPEKERSNAMNFAMRTLTRMARWPKRGGGTRSALRLLRDRLESVPQQRSRTAANGVHEGAAG